jgi:hypothetical protein
MKIRASGKLAQTSGVMAFSLFVGVHLSDAALHGLGPESRMRGPEAVIWLFEVNRDGVAVW